MRKPPGSTIKGGKVYLVRPVTHLETPAQRLLGENSEQARLDNDQHGGGLTD